MRGGPLHGSLALALVAVALARVKVRVGQQLLQAPQASTTASATNAGSTTAAPGGTTCASPLPFDCSGQDTDTVNKGSGASCPGDAGTCDSGICCEAPATCATTPFNCSGQVNATVNVGSVVTCEGNASTCDAGTCCEAPATCATAPFDCSGQVNATVNVGSAVTCSGNAGTCNASTCCEAPATCSTTPFDCSGQVSATMNVGSNVTCSGNAGTCDAGTCCEAACMQPSASSGCTSAGGNCSKVFVPSASLCVECIQGTSTPITEANVGSLQPLALLCSQAFASPAPAPAQSPVPAPAPAPASVPMMIADENNTFLNRSGTSWRTAVVNRSAIPSLREDSLASEAMDGAQPGFDDLDCVSKDGFVTPDEVATYCVMNGIPYAEGKVLFDVVDVNHDGLISRKEFSESHPVGDSVLEDLRPSFRDIDFDGDTLLSSKEWMSFCHGWMVPNLTIATCRDLFNVSDTNEPKGFIDDAEFKTAGSKCKSVDDGNCSLLAIAWQLGGHGKRKKTELALLRGSPTQALQKVDFHLSGRELFGIVHRHRHSQTQLKGEAIRRSNGAGRLSGASD